MSCKDVCVLVGGHRILGCSRKIFSERLSREGRENEQGG